MLTSLIQELQNIVGRFEWLDLLDVLIVAFIFYVIFTLVKGTRAIQMMLGVMIIILMYVVSEMTGLATTHRLLYFILYIIPFAVVVIFQAAIRKILASIGASPIEIFSNSKSGNGNRQVLKDIALASRSLAEKKIGALIVMEREQGLRTYIETGIALDALLSYDLIMTIFASNTPLHDGSIIVQENRAAAASCFLPLTLNPIMSREFGTRHRAAIGITEETDAIAVIVSEERGIISIAVDGEISSGFKAESLEEKLLELLKVKRKSAKK